MSSFDEAITQEPERFIGYAFKHNKDISDFEEFKDALNKGMNHAKGDIDEETIIKLFEKNETRRLIKQNVNQEEYEKLYGDGNVVKREAISPTKSVVIVSPKVKVKNYSRSGTTIRGYNRTYNRWSPAQVRFLSVRKAKKISPKQITSEFNAHFKDNPRSASSIKTKAFRL